MIYRYSCGCFNSFNTEKLCNAVHLPYPCVMHKRIKGGGNTKVFVKRTEVTTRSVGVRIKALVVER